MCYYVSKLYSMEILKMKCEFLKDDNDSIWFTFAYDIYTRPIKGREVEKSKITQLQQINQDHKAQLMQQLAVHK